MFHDSSLNMARPNVLVRTIHGRKYRSQLPFATMKKCNPQNIRWNHGGNPSATSRISTWWCSLILPLIPFQHKLLHPSTCQAKTSTCQALCANTREDDYLTWWGSTAANGEYIWLEFSKRWFLTWIMATLLHSLQSLALTSWHSCPSYIM